MHELEVQQIELEMQNEELMSIFSERERVDESLKASESRYRRLFESAKDGILILDAETGMIADVNPFMIEMLGYSKHQFLDKAIWEIGFFKDLFANQDKFSELQQKEYVRYDDLPLETADGRKISVEFVSNSYFEENKKVIQCNIREITEQKNMQNGIKFQADLLNNVGQAVIAIDMLDNVTYWNRAAEKIYGWSSSEAIGQNIDYLIPSQPTKKQIKEILKEISEGNSWTGGFLMNRKDRSSFSACVTFNPIFDSKGELIGVTEISSDNTEQKKAEQNLIVANEELIIQNIEKEKRAGELIIANKELAFQNEEKEKRAEELIIANKELAFQNNEKEERAVELIIAKNKAEESDRLKSAFLANMSHEVRTPLNSIIGFSELLGDPDFEEDQKNEFIQHIIASGNNLLSIISDIMDISKIESGEITIRKKQIDAQKFISGIKEQFAFQTEAKKLELKLTSPDTDEETVFIADAERLMQIFNNLIGNALKFTSEGKIEIGYHPKGKMVEFFVKDTGIGIPAEYHDKIFERFRQVEDAKTRTYGGNGLGLTITKNLVELMGGKIRLESKKGEGSAFYFTMPGN